VVFNWLDNHQTGQVSQKQLASGISKVKTMLVATVAELLQGHPRARVACMSKSQAVQMTRSTLNSIPERNFRKFLQEICPEKYVTKDKWMEMAKDNIRLQHFILRCCGDHLNQLTSFEELTSANAVSPVPMDTKEIFIMVDNKCIVVR